MTCDASESAFLVLDRVFLDGESGDEYKEHLVLHLLGIDGDESNNKYVRN